MYVRLCVLYSLKQFNKFYLPHKPYNSIFVILIIMCILIPQSLLGRRLDVGKLDR